MPNPRQPFLHDLVTVLAAPTQALSRRDGQIDGAGAQGVLHGDVRVLSRVEVTVNDLAGEHIATYGDDQLTFSSLLRGLPGVR
jgi:N-terminal domain of (some) glycogen debranching enzymes